MCLPLLAAAPLAASGAAATTAAAAAGMSAAGMGVGAAALGASSTALAATTAAAAGMSAAGMGVGAAALGASATAAASTLGMTAATTSSLTTALSTASFLTSTVGSLLSFNAQQDAANDMAKAANQQYQAEQAQIAERARQEQIQGMIENDQLYRNAVLGMAATKTASAAQGRGGIDPRLADFAMNADAAAGLAKKELGWKMSALQEKASQSTIVAQRAFDTARSAFSPEAYLGLGLDVASNFFSSTATFGSSPFESAASYNARLGLPNLS